MVNKKIRVIQVAYDRQKRNALPNSLGLARWINELYAQVQAIAWGDGSIVLHKGLLTFNRRHPDAIVYVMAHEIGHWVLGHLGWKHPWCASSNRRHKQCEKDADLYAITLMRKAGYNHCAAAENWKRMLYKFGNRGGSTHPTPRERYNYLRCKR